MSDSRRVNEVHANCEPLNGDGLLHRLARQNNYKELAKVSPGPGVNCQNNRMETPLIVAAQASAIRTISSLTALGADVDAQDAQGNTALHYAVLNSSERAIDSLSCIYANRGVADSFFRGSLVGKNGKRVWKIWENLGKFGKNGKNWEKWEKMGKIGKNGKKWKKLEKL
jgi:ankyrin repeat protein